MVRLVPSSSIDLEEWPTCKLMQSMFYVWGVASITSPFS